MACLSVPRVSLLISALSAKGCRLYFANLRVTNRRAPLSSTLSPLPLLESSVSRFLNITRIRSLAPSKWVYFESLVCYHQLGQSTKDEGEVFACEINTTQPPYMTVYTTPPAITFGAPKNLSPGVLYSGGVIYNVPRS